MTQDLGIRKIRAQWPWVRSVDGKEIELRHWQHFSEEAPLNARVLEHLVVEVSTRSYPRNLELPVADPLAMMTPSLPTHVQQTPFLG